MKLETRKINVMLPSGQYLVSAKINKHRGVAVLSLTDFESDERVIVSLDDGKPLTATPLLVEKDLAVVKAALTGEAKPIDAKKTRKKSKVEKVVDGVVAKPIGLVSVSVVAPAIEGYVEGVKELPF